MRPTLLPLGELAIPTHDAFLLLGVAAAFAFYLWEARRRRKLTEKTLWVAIGALLGGAVFGKLSTGWQYLATAPEPTLQGLWLQGGRSVLGGLAGAYFGAIVTKRIVGYRERTGDLFAPAVALGLAIGRIGCFLTEQVGTPTSLPWGITLDPAIGSQIANCPQCVSGIPLHPSFLYEIAFLALAFGGLLVLRGRIPVQGELLKIFLLSYGLFRFVVEFVRGNPEFWLGLSGSQLFLLVTVPFVGVYFLRQWSQGAYRTRQVAT
ncbi:MAG: prolipoprotein diacylglyceryl transferase [Acidimicrobiia bacterium]